MNIFVWSEQTTTLQRGNNTANMAEWMADWKNCWTNELNDAQKWEGELKMTCVYFCCCRIISMLFYGLHRCFFPLVCRLTAAEKRESAGEKCTHVNSRFSLIPKGGNSHTKFTRTKHGERETLNELKKHFSPNKKDGEFLRRYFGRSVITDFVRLNH